MKEDCKIPEVGEDLIDAWVSLFKSQLEPDSQPFEWTDLMVTSTCFRALHKARQEGELNLDDFIQEEKRDYILGERLRGLDIAFDNIADEVSMSKNTLKKLITCLISK